LCSQLSKWATDWTTTSTIADAGAHIISP